MTNLSKIKRERMLAYLEQLKALNDDEEHIRAITEIENVLTEKKYGLVWEEHSEQVNEMLAHNIPVFIEDGTRKIVADEEEPYNFLLEGDNLHSLKLLEKTHKGKIDLIYIDPPYNTGNKDFMYDDRFIDKTDGYSHSKWLSFMEKRLLIARELLSDEGVIFISIDEKEFSQLKLLSDEIFGEYNYLNEIIWQKLTASKAQSLYFSNLHEMILVYRKSEKTVLNKLYLQSLHDSKTYNKQEEDTGRWYGTFDFTQKGQGEGKHFGELFIEPPTGKHWIWSQEKINEGIKSNLIVFTKNGTPRVKRYLDDKKGNLIGDIWIDEEIKPLSANSSERVGFDTQKPLSLIKRILKTKNDNSIILDFFAGSGTTGHAVAQLNAEDGGNRRYILCTNNENNICEEVTYQRLKNIQTDLPHNLKYFKTDFIKKFNQDESISSRMMEHIKELIELENHIEIDGKKVIMLEREEQLTKVLESIQDGGKLFIPSGFFLSQTDQAFLDKKDITVIEIPEYYFRNELREVGEL